jgi:GTP cyclohydrolase II
VSLLVLSAESGTPKNLKEIVAISESDAPALVISGRRARVLGLPVSGLKSVRIAASDMDFQVLQTLADPLSEAPDLPRDKLDVREVDGHSGEQAAVLLTKLARLLPSAIVADIKDPLAADIGSWAARHQLLMVDAGDVFQYDRVASRALRPVSRARVPLLGAEMTTIVAFRPIDGGLEHLAVVLGNPSPAKPTLTRLHSECFTGDLLGSLRCDCGDQLRGAIEEISAAGGGVLLYLAQEGRGIGLVNKLRAYELQDRGFDTLAANEQLGFEADERVYFPAAEMLRQLGFIRVRLLTNNPDKVDGLARSGIEVIERVPHAFPSNEHNDFYLRTKAKHGGHLM